MLTVSVTYLYVTIKLSQWFIRANHTQCDCIVANYCRHTFTVQFRLSYQFFCGIAVCTTNFRTVLYDYFNCYHHTVHNIMHGMV